MPSDKTDLLYYYTSHIPGLFKVHHCTNYNFFAKNF